MEDYIVNVKEEVSESENNVKDAGLVKDIVSSPSIKENIKLVDESCYSDQVIELTEDEILVKSACDPLESIPVASASNYESNHSDEDLESKVEALKLTEMKIIDVSISSTNNNSDSSTAMIISQTDKKYGVSTTFRSDPCNKNIIPNYSSPDILCCNTLPVHYTT